MWFKQIQLFQLKETRPFVLEQLLEKLALLAFRPCLPSLPSSSGWVSPIDEEGAPLARLVNEKIMLCLQFEDKILPAAVIRQELINKAKEIEKAQDRKVRQKEKLALRDEIILTLLPRAFSKITRVYAYIDLKNSKLVLGSKNPKKTEEFLAICKKSVSEHIHPFEVGKISATITHWLQHQNYPKIFGIEKSAVLQDPNHKQRVIRCQQQDLFAQSIQQLVKDGCQVMQLAFSWQDRINFVLNDNLSLSAIKYNEEIIGHSQELEAETREQQFDADFYIMGESLSALFGDLLENFLPEQSQLQQA